MDDYRAVRGSHPLSLSIFDLLADTAPQLYPEFMRVSTIGRINDILQGRSESGFTVEWLLGELRERAGAEYPKRTETLCQEVENFQAQKAMLTIPYTKTSDKEYKYRIWDPGAKRPLKRINQRLYDFAAKAGFPPGFFKDSHFDHVTLYCIPDYTDLSGSRFLDCNFAVCRIVGAYFADAAIYSSAFHTCLIESSSFIRANLANTHYYDCAMLSVSFNRARLNRCNTIACDMNHVIYAQTTLDGCSFGRVNAGEIIDLDTATITKGGATKEECVQNRASIFEALGVPQPAPPPGRTNLVPFKPKRHTGPER